jgi:hypothetical protein
MRLGLVENLGILLAHHHRREPFDETEPTATELAITLQIVFINPDLILEEITEGVKGSALRIDNQMGCFSEKQTGFFIVRKEVGQAEHCGVRVATHNRNVINQLMDYLIGITR